MTEASKTRRRNVAIIVVVALGAGAIYFVPKSMLLVLKPEPGFKGATFLMERMSETKFVDSPSAICRREGKSPNFGAFGLTCSDVVVLATDEYKIHIRLPYVQWLESVAGERR